MHLSGYIVKAASRWCVLCYVYASDPFPCPEGPYDCGTLIYPIPPRPLLPLCISCYVRVVELLGEVELPLQQSP